MSVPFLPGSFKSNADRDEKIKYYNTLLKFRSRLNLNNEKYSQIIQEQMEEGTPSTPFPIIPLEARYDNLNSQRQAAIKAVASITKQEQANQFVHAYLNSLEEIVLFNKQFQDFYRQKLQNTRNITPFWLNQQWEQYKPTIRSTQTETITETEETRPTNESPAQKKERIWQRYKVGIKQFFEQTETFEEFKDEIVTMSSTIGENVDVADVVNRLYKEIKNRNPPRSLPGSGSKMKKIFNLLKER